MTITTDRLGHYFTDDYRIPTAAEWREHVGALVAHVRSGECLRRCDPAPLAQAHRGSWMSDDQWLIYLAGWWQGRALGTCGSGRCTSR